MASLGARLGRLLDDTSATSADILLVCSDDGSLLPAHRVILAASSEPLALLTQEQPEPPPLQHYSPAFPSSATLSGEARLARLPRFVVRGVRGDTLRAVLRFAYTGAAEVGVHNAVELLVAAEKFDLPELRAAADKVLPRLLRDDNACALLARGAECVPPFFLPRAHGGRPAHCTPAHTHTHTRARPTPPFAERAPPPS